MTKVIQLTLYSEAPENAPRPPPCRNAYLHRALNHAGAGQTGTAYNVKDALLAVLPLTGSVFQGYYSSLLYSSFLYLGENPPCLAKHVLGILLCGY